MLDHYDRTGVFDLTIDEPWYTTMLDYKSNYKNEKAKKYVDEIQNQLDYLENYQKEMIDNGLG